MTRSHHESIIPALQVLLSPLAGLLAAKVVQIVTKGGKK